MHELRASNRHRTFKAGTIAFNRAGGITCTVRNLSDGGACLEVPSPIGVPDDFTLIIECDHFTRSCHVRWRTGHRIGVAFAA